MPTRIFQEGNFTVIDVDATGEKNYHSSQTTFTGPINSQYRVLYNNVTVAQGAYTDFRDQADSPFGSEALFLTHLRTNVGAFSSGGATSSTTGWAQYVDTVYTVSNKFVIAQGSTLDLPNNAGTVIDTYLPEGVSTFYNSGTTKIMPAAIGDFYTIRINFSVSNDNVNGLAELDLDIGGAQGVILRRNITFPKGANTEIPYSSTNLIFTLDTFVANGGQLQIASDTGDTSIWDIQYVIARGGAGNA